MFTEKIKNTLKSAAKKLTVVAKRAFVAQVEISVIQQATGLKKQGYRTISSCPV